MRNQNGWGSARHAGEWNTFVEERVSSGVTKGTTASTRSVRESVRDAKVIPLNDVTADDDVRIRTEIRELDRVLGRRIVPGSLVLVGGDPGIGKSTLLLQVCQRLADRKKVLYISGEESQAQIKLRGESHGSICIRPISAVRDESGDDPRRDREGEAGAGDH